MDLKAEIARVAGEQHRETEVVARDLASAILEAAREAWGRERELEGQFNAETNAVDVYQIIRVVECVDPARTTSEIDVESASAFGLELGEELLVQVFYRDEDGAKAAQQEQSFGHLPPSLEVLAAGLSFGARPEWMRPLWPHRRMPWRFGGPVMLPPMAEALDVLERWLDDAGANVQRRGATPAQLDVARGLGPTASGLVALHERFGPSERVDGEPLAWMGCNLRSIDESLALRQEMIGVMKVLREDDEVSETWWNASWLPVFGGHDSGGMHCLDLATGAVVSWSKDGPERPVEAPSLEAWLGVIALAAQSGLLMWKPGGGVCFDFAVDPMVAQWFRDLQRLALPGFPKTQ